MAAPLVLDLAANLAAAAIYVAVARIVAARPVEATAVPARHAFSWWWYVLALLSLYGALADVVSLLGAWTVPLLVSATHVLLLAVLLGLAGLLYYLVYLYTGLRWAWRPILAFYAVFWALLVYAVEAMEPIGIRPGVLTPRLAFLHAPDQTLLAPLLGAALVLPILGGAVGYFTLFFKVREPAQRFRVAVVSLSILLWFGFSLVGTLTPLNESLAWSVLARAGSLAAALSVYAAYRPPRWVQRRWGVEGVPAR